MNDREARLVLAALVEPGLWSLHDAVLRHGAVPVAEALLSGRALPGLPVRLVDGVQGRVGRRRPQLEDLDRLGARLLVPGDDEWPDHLDWSRGSKELPAPPLSLCVRGGGHLGAVTERSVALVGARACSSYGTWVARELGIGVADRGWAVVSGGAYGIDASAHRGALAAAEGVTVAVLACGVDVPYPSGNAPLLAEVRERGLVVSEVLPGVHPTRGRFLVRNRLIAALTRGTVVVEAALRSGSLSSANRAADLSRHVMAVPGPVTSAGSAGCHLLVRERGAALVTSAADVLAVTASAGEALPVEPRGERRVRDDLSRAARELLEVLPVRGGLGEAALAQRLGIHVMLVQQLLPPLQINGLVRRGEDGWHLTQLGSGR